MRLAGMMVLVLAGVVQAQLTVRPRDGQAAARVFEVAEWVVEPGRQYSNPFDPREVAVDATFTGPGGRLITLPGFWYQPQRREVQDGRERIVEAGPGQWLVRFCPTIAGEWKISVAVKEGDGRREAAGASFVVASSKHAGFVRRSPHHWRYFQFDSGESYFLVGPNVCWGGRGGLGNYERWFGDLARAGGNFARLWMTYPGREVETKAAGLGRYDQQACWLYDQALELAERNGLRCMLAMNSYGDYIDGGHFGEGRWPISPLNAANGGPATRPADVFAMPELREHYKRRLRYMVGRYSAYTSLGFWEFFNEQDGAKGIVPADWVAEMAAWLRANDPYQRLITTSFSGTKDAPAVWDLPGIDLTQRHMYGGDEPMWDAAPLIVANVRAHDRYRKPHLVGEIGLSWKQSDNRYDTAGLGTSLHNALWAAAMSGSAGGAHHWWWDNYIAPKNLWHCYTGLSRFAADVDWAKRRFEPVRITGPMRPEGPETFADVRIPADGQWGGSAGRVVEIDPDGTIRGMLPGYLYGPAKPELRGKVLIQVKLPRPSQMTLRIASVSDSAGVCVSVDDEVVTGFPFSAQPGAFDQQSAKRMDYGGYQAVFNKDRTVEIPAGEHTIALENLSGDWASITSVTFSEALSSRYSGLRVLALADGEAGETIAWLQDPSSHGGNDAAGLTPKRFEGLTMVVPVEREGAYRVRWWDTRSGEVVKEVRLAAEKNVLVLNVPSFERDIALRVQRP